MTNRRTAMTTLGLVAVSIALLTGCAGGAQSKADACKLLESDVSGSASTLSAAFGKITDDPSAAEKALKAFEVKMAASVAKVTNPTVKSAGDAAVGSLTALDGDLKKYSTDPSDSSVVDSLQSNASKVQKTFGTLGSVCGA